MTGKEKKLRKLIDKVALSMHAKRKFRGFLELVGTVDIPFHELSEELEICEQGIRKYIYKAKEELGIDVVTGRRVCRFTSKSLRRVKKIFRCLNDMEREK